MFKKIGFTVSQVYRSLLFALESAAINKLRTGLSLLGITIGIFAIITVFTLVDSIEIKLRNDFDALGSNTVYVEKWPWAGGGDWWKYWNRPQVRVNEYYELRSLFPQAEAMAFSIPFSRTVRTGAVYLENTSILGVTYDYNRIRKMDVGTGRYFTPFEADNGARVAVVGQTIVDELFGPEVDPLGQVIQIRGRKLSIVGVFEKVGSDMMGLSVDETVVIPMQTSRSLANMRWANTSVGIKAPPDADMEEFKAELTSAMRRIRRLSPQTEDNFAVNEMSIINNELDAMFATLNVAGGIIGIFSILVGGFGIANIMFVSVKERTPQIGIQKALGARPYFILFQFLFEAIILSVAGGAVGLLLIFLGLLVVNSLQDFEIVLTLGNIVLGLVISSVVGTLSGFFPAWSAARMEPVKAIFNT